MDAKGEPDFNRSLGSEVRKRLEQLDFIVSRVKQLEVEATAAFSRFRAEFEEHARIADEYDGHPNPPALPPLTRITAEEFAIRHKATFEMELLTETFYYLAGRVRTIAKHSENPLPGLSSFECAGVRNTRNKLLEHPEGKDSKVHMLSFAWGAPRGPVVKAIRWADQAEIFPDKGLYENAEEFRTSFERLLRNSLGSV